MPPAVSSQAGERERERPVPGPDRADRSIRGRERELTARARADAHPIDGPEGRPQCECTYPLGGSVDQAWCMTAESRESRRESVEVKRAR